MKTKRFREAYQINVGRNDLLLTVEVQGCVYPAEPMVRYYKDGSGYPGCPAEVEFDDIWVSDVTGDFGTIDRVGRDDWFKILDDIAQDYLEYFEAKVMESDED
jgi:hypothetical protein